MAVRVVAYALELHVGHLSDALGSRRTQLANLRDIPPPRVDVPDPDVAEGDHGLVLNRHCARGQRRGSGRVGQQVTPGARGIARVGGIEVELHEECAPSDWMETKCELGEDAEVAAASAQAPEQIWVLRLRGADDAPVGGHD